jgi:phage terminase large subunit GpA-like protein
MSNSTDRVTEILRECWQRTWQPPDRTSVWQWAERHIQTIPYSPMPGRFRIENSPQIREPMEAIVDPTIRQVCIIAAVQAAKTMAGEIALCYVIANLPGPALWLSATDEDAKDQSESRLQKLFAECEPVRALFPANRHEKRHTTIHFSNSMPLWMLGAHNKTNLQRRSIRWVFADECWAYVPGHMAEAEARVTAFGWLGKCIWMSQGGVDGDDIGRKFETTDQRFWTFACPECGHRQPFKWENVEWSKDCKDENEQYLFARVRKTACLRCEGCNTYLPDSDEMRRRLNATGAFVPQNPRAAKENVGFHWNALATMSWGQLAEQYLRAKMAARQGDLVPLQNFTQKRLALAWRDQPDDVDLEIVPSGYKRGELWEQEACIDAHGRIQPPPPPERSVPLRMLCADVQQTCLYAIVRSWAVDGSSRLIWSERLLTFDDLEALQERFKIHPSLVFVDAGYASSMVYHECAKRKWTAMMGDARETFVHRVKGKPPVQRFYSPRRTVVLRHDLACSMFFWSNLACKDTLARLRRNKEQETGPTWQIPEDIDADYLAQMQSEHRVQEKSGKWVWKQIGDRANHYWDAEVLAVAAAFMVKLIGAESISQKAEASS